MPLDERLPRTCGDRPAEGDLSGNGQVAPPRTAGIRPDQVAPRLAAYIAGLDPGSAAALRRGPLVGAGAAAFWKLVAEYAPDGATLDEEGWANLVQAIAILTPKGTETDRKRAHDPTIPMGAALYEAGVSELRLARLLDAPREMRRDLAVRLCRRLAATDRKRFDLRTLAVLILDGSEKTKKTNHRIARDYYRAETKAGRRAGHTSDEPDGQEVSSNA